VKEVGHAFAVVSAANGLPQEGRNVDHLDLVTALKLVIKGACVGYLPTTTRSGTTAADNG